MKRLHEACRREWAELEKVALGYVEELCEARCEAKRLREERDAALRGDHVPLSDLESAWRVAAEYKKQAEDVARLEAENDRLRTQLLELEVRAGWGGFA